MVDLLRSTGAFIVELLRLSGGSKAVFSSLFDEEQPILMIVFLLTLYSSKEIPYFNDRVTKQNNPSTNHSELQTDRRDHVIPSRVLSSSDVMH